MLLGSAQKTSSACLFGPWDFDGLSDAPLAVFQGASEAPISVSYGSTIRSALGATSGALDLVGAMWNLDGGRSKWLQKCHNRADQIPFIGRVFPARPGWPEAQLLTISQVWKSASDPELKRGREVGMAAQDKDLCAGWLSKL
jgi:hypothetical protein